MLYTAETAPPSQRSESVNLNHIPSGAKQSEGHPRRQSEVQCSAVKHGAELLIALLGLTKRIKSPRIKGHGVVCRLLCLRRVVIHPVTQPEQVSGDGTFEYAKGGTTIRKGPIAGTLHFTDFAEDIDSQLLRDLRELQRTTSSLLSRDPLATQFTVFVKFSSTMSGCGNPQCNCGTACTGCNCPSRMDDSLGNASFECDVGGCSCDSCANCAPSCGCNSCSSTH